MSCPRTTDAGAYVLGALDAAERRAFDEHLVTCEQCRAAVAEVEDLPALLDRVPADLVERLATPDVPWADPPPAGLLPDLLRSARGEERSRRRRRTVAGALALAAVSAALLVLPGSPARLPWGEPAAPSAVAETLALEAAEPGPVSASVRLDDVAWGTRIELTCTYATADGGYGPSAPLPDYVLTVRSADGSSEDVATWRAVPGREITVPASTSTPREDIVGVDLRGADGEVLLSAGA